MAGVTLT
ncbi:hypothetical protein E2C01_089338 [Portunus trituberculatus]|nr:hypothetical protein [Portunus trituberculatus]